MIEFSGSAPGGGKALAVFEALLNERSRLKPFAHQIEGSHALTTHRYFFLADEMGAMKTKQVIDAAHVLYLREDIDRVIVVCPASVRPVWYDPELGELAKHLWKGIPSDIVDYHSKFHTWNWRQEVKSPANPLQWFITNYDFLRSGAEVERVGRRKVYHYPNVEELGQYCSDKTLLVCDESSAIKSHKAHQSRATLQLRNKCGWIWLLNGTPIANNPLDMYAQGRVLDYRIFDCADFYQFRARYAVVTTERGFMQILKFTNLDDMQRRMAPYILRRLKKDCTDLPEKLPAVNIAVPMTPKVWSIYGEMRDELCAWLERNAVSAAPHAATKVLRLAQITSGFLGGVERAVEDEEMEATLPEFDWGVTEPIAAVGPREPLETTREIGREKLDFVLKWFKEHLEIEDPLKLLVWCRFRPELERLAREAMSLHTHIQVAKFYGNQDDEERMTALRLLHPKTSPPFPLLVAGTPQTGRTAFDFTAVHHVVYMSHDFSLYTRKQSEDRVHRQGQHADVSYYNIIATGPKGQKTIDHLTLKVLENKAAIADWTTSAWVRALKEE